MIAAIKNLSTTVMVSEDVSKLLQVDPRCEFMGMVNQLLDKHNTEVIRGRINVLISIATRELWSNLIEP